MSGCSRIGRRLLVVRAGGVGPDEPRVPDLPGCDQVGLLGTLDLAVDRRVGSTGLGRDLGQAECEIGIAERQREDLPCCWERRMGKSAGAGCLSTIRRVLFYLRTVDARVLGSHDDGCAC